MCSEAFLFFWVAHTQKIFYFLGKKLIICIYYNLGTKFSNTKGCHIVILKKKKNCSYEVIFNVNHLIHNQN